MSVIKGLMWCMAVLFAQLGLLRYIDLRVATMERLKEPPLEPVEGSVPGESAAFEKQGELDA
ncbi:hypothetical protein ACUY1T_20845 [Billgrantia sp. Q4P2]|uniref:hypothetical protein n=1 Tax=Billgrantia sp. Q4P2 TaxID=3463857 RepID=UPI00405740A1